jgi:hypothetical protein
VDNFLKKIVNKVVHFSESMYLYNSPALIGHRKKIIKESRRSKIDSQESETVKVPISC